jgi:hypothetical protein
MSTRARVTSSYPMIGGFFINGQAHKTLLIRAVGPTMAQYGIANPVPDPKLVLFLGAQSIRENDDWSNDPLAGRIPTIFGNKLGNTIKFKLSDKKVITPNPAISESLSLLPKLLISKG